MIHSKMITNRITIIYNNEGKRKTKEKKKKIVNEKAAIPVIESLERFTLKYYRMLQCLDGYQGRSQAFCVVTAHLVSRVRFRVARLNLFQYNIFRTFPYHELFKIKC